MPDEGGWTVAYSTREQMSKMFGAYAEQHRYLGHIVLRYEQFIDADGRMEVRVWLSDGSKIRVIER